MSLMFLFPLGLAALAAWALPLLLHLVRREQQAPTDFAALRWLSVRAKPRQRLRFDELALLLARLALIAALALLLARPARVGGDDRASWEVFHPALDAPTVTGDDGVERRWLADGFPPIASKRPAAAPVTASLLRQLDAELPAGADLVVHVPATLGGLDGGRVQLSRPVAWRVDTAPAAEALVQAAAALPAPRLVVRHDEAHRADMRWLRAAARAWRAASAAADSPAAADANLDIAPLDAALPAPDGAVLAWLSAGPMPAPVRAWVEAGGTVLLPVDAERTDAKPGADHAAGADDTAADTSALGRGRVVRLRHALRPAEWPLLLDAGFPRALRDLLTPPAPLPARADAAAVAPVDGGPGFEPAPREFPGILVALVLALFALERWLATGRRAGRPA
jgi:hypothetical protein